MKTKKIRLLSLVVMFFVLVGVMPLENAYGLSEREPNNTTSQATPIKLGVEYEGNIKDTLDTDYYKFTVPEDGFITLTTTMKYNEFLFMINKDGKRLNSNSEYYYGYFDTSSPNGTLTSPKIGLGKGTYYLIVDGILGTDNGAKYKFKVNYTKGKYEKEINDTKEQAEIIKVNTEYKGSIRVKSWGDDDWYKINIPKRGVISVDIKKTGKTSVNPTVVLYDRTGKERFFTNKMESNTFTSHNIGVNKGTYYLKIDGLVQEHEKNEYTFKVRHTATNDWEIEPNGNLKTPTPIITDKWVKASVVPGSYWDNDYYKFTLTKDSEVVIKMDYPESLKGHGHLDGVSGKTSTIYEWTLFDGRQKQLTSYGYPDKSIETNKPEEKGASWHLYTYADETQTSTVKLKKGTYYIRLNASSYSAGGKDYRFIVSTGKKKTSIQNAYISGIKDKTFTGSAIGQNPTVKVGNKTLKKGTDYTLTYKNNINTGTATVTITGKGSYSGSVSRTFKITKGFVRASGKNRYQTAIAIGNKVKALNRNKKFNYIIVASGQNYPDALGGAYLAKVKNAPILLTTAGRETDTINFIKKNLNKGGTVYVLGGTGVVSNNFTKKLKSAGIKYSRKGGKNRYETNTSTLTLAGIKGKNLIVTTGKDFPDALISSATGNPIMIVSGDKLTNSQVKLLKKNKVKSVTIVSTGKAVSTKLEAALKKASGVKVNRVTASSRYALSKTVAEKYFKSPKNVVIATGKAFPDALSGGPLAIKLKAPILLADSSNSSYAKSYIKSKSVKQGYILGGTGAVSAKVESGLF